MHGIEPNKTVVHKLHTSATAPPDGSPHTLDLRKTHITPNHAVALSSSLSHVTAPELILQECALDDESAVCILRSLLMNSTVRKLDISSNNIQSTQATGISTQTRAQSSNCIAGSAVR